MYASTRARTHLHTHKLHTETKITLQNAELGWKRNLPHKIDYYCCYYTVLLRVFCRWGADGGGGESKAGCSKIQSKKGMASERGRKKKTPKKTQCRALNANIIACLKSDVVFVAFKAKVFGVGLTLQYRSSQRWFSSPSACPLQHGTSC